jgi:hypothetical protein
MEKQLQVSTFYRSRFQPFFLRISPLVSVVVITIRNDNGVNTLITCLSHSVNFPPILLYSLEAKIEEILFTCIRNAADLFFK